MTFPDDDKQRDQSPFTDSDLKRLKEHIDQPGYELHTKRYKALLARLEAAERFIISNGLLNPHSRKLYRAWLKAAGQ